MQGLSNRDHVEYYHRRCRIARDRSSRDREDLANGELNAHVAQVLTPLALLERLRLLFCSNIVATEQEVST
jgi:hypothetical protein